MAQGDPLPSKYRLGGPKSSSDFAPCLSGWDRGYPGGIRPLTPLPTTQTAHELYETVKGAIHTFFTKNRRGLRFALDGGTNKASPARLCCREWEQWIGRSPKR
jgi:hypothetical protein